MGLISGILTLPLAPIRVVLWLGEVLQEQVNRELYDPAVIRRQLEELDEARAAGLISEEEAAQREEELLSRLIQVNTGSTAPITSGEAR